MSQNFFSFSSFVLLSFASSRTESARRLVVRFFTFSLLLVSLLVSLCRVLTTHSLSGTLTVEQIYQDRDKFASLVREVAAPDVGRMGIEILSFTIKVSNLSLPHLDVFFFLLLFKY